jgi:hypothetical protein
MDTENEIATQKVVKMVQELLLNQRDRSAITPALIGEKIDQVLALNARWATLVDRARATDELVRRFSLWIGQNSTLSSAEGHIAWLSAARKREWRYWQRYREWLERSLSYTAIEALDATTDEILGLLEDPQREGQWDRRGLIVGHVQSGKTANYTGLICKGADAGYKIIIVLAGLHNNLRSQTQVRLDEGFLGYETKPVPDDLRIIGVGEIDGDPSIRPNYATNRSESGDFVTAAARNLGITPEQRPWLFVVKKNKTVLERLYRWIRNHVSDQEEPQTGRRIVTRLPLLVIDDEADHASVDTGEQIFDAEGRPDEEHEPTAINRRVRLILHSFARAAYVGYTATPFANIFIHERGATREEGPDLFPSAFIINLATPSDYIGPARVFGKASTDGRTGGLPLVRTITDQDSAADPGVWIPPDHKNGHLPRHRGADALPPSLVEAIDSFLLASAARRARGQRGHHSSMLIHVTRFNSVQAEVRRQVDMHLRHMRQRITRRIDDTALIARLRDLWEHDFVPANEAMRLSNPELVDSALPAWHAVEAELSEVLQDVEARTINGMAKDALDYVDQEGRGLTVIAIGGDKLARGLTLGGLSTSYFLRASKMYDTLMQMGRWFGYRPGYVDVCRLYTTAELIEWFGHIADASEELREEFDRMAASGATPRDYGLRVQSHPVLLVTSRLKMRAARDMMLSFSGELLETVALFKDPAVLRHNLGAVSKLIRAIGRPVESDRIERARGGRAMRWKGYLWKSVRSADIVDFLSTYKTHPEAYKVRSELLVEFIRSLNEVGELTEWTVAVIGGGEGAEYELATDVRVDMLQRKSNRQHPDRYSIGRLLSPRDESIDLDEAAWNAALETTRANWKRDPARTAADSEPPDEPSGPYIRNIRGFGAAGVPAAPQRGLLLLYILDPLKAELPSGTPPVAALGVSFPGSNSGRKVLYKVNSVQWRQWEAEYGAAD